MFQGLRIRKKFLQVRHLGTGSYMFGPLLSQLGCEFLTGYSGNKLRERVTPQLLDCFEWIEVTFSKLRETFFGEVNCSLL